MMRWHTRLSLSHCWAGFHVIFDGFHLPSSKSFAYWQSPEVEMSLITHQRLFADLNSHVSCSITADKRQVGSHGQHPSVCALSESYTDGNGDLCVKFSLTLRSEMPSNTACRWAEWLGLLCRVLSSLATLSGIRTLLHYKLFSSM
jgi:hypothetical protein